MSALITAVVTFQPGKPYGVGFTFKERHMKIDPGFRCEVVSGIKTHKPIATRTLPTKDAARKELVAQLKRHEIRGVIKFQERLHAGA